MNIYWTVYKNLESQFVNLMFDIHIDDTQLGVYSLKISDLILRAAIEIESISKDLYILNQGTKTTHIKYDEDALKHLNSVWGLEQKIIIISYTNCFLSDRILYPFVKSELRSGTQRWTFAWNNAYQNIKHDRANSLKFGSVKYLFQIMSALFTLNIYYKDEVFELQRDIQSTTFPINLGSDIFSINLHKSVSYSGNGVYQKAADFYQCIYRTQMTKECRDKIDAATKQRHEVLGQVYSKHPKILDYLAKNDIRSYAGKNIFIDILGEEEYYKIQDKAFIEITSPTYQNLQYEAVLNRNDL